MSIDRKKRDIAVALTKGVVGAAPWVGPLVAEVIGTLIPNQRIDRIASFVTKLDEKVSGIEKEQLKRRFTTPESIDLFEDGCFQATRALSEERKEYIASLIKNSLTDDQLEQIQYKQLLSILGELNDVEILLLKSLSLDIPECQEFDKQHENVFKRSGILSVSPIPKDTFLQSYEAHLERIGLIGVGELTPGITPLGCLLLKSIDQGGEF